jgi:hypothetical protein
MIKPEGEAIHSLNWRFMRTTVEYAHASVPIAGDMARFDAQGVDRIDAEAMGR